MIRAKMAGLQFKGELRAVLIRTDGTHRDFGVIATDHVSVPQWCRIYACLKRGGHLPALMTFGAFLAWALGTHGGIAPWVLGLVTSAGVNYMAADFLANSTNRINAFNWHDSGTGTNTESTSDTGLQSATGIARVTGTQSNPQPNQYKTIGKITYDGSYQITEWGLFSAVSGPSLWDRRVFSARNVSLGQSIEYAYTLTIIAGG